MSQFSSIERLFARHGLTPVESVEPLSGGQLNSVVRVNGEWVLRWREARVSTGSLKREAALLDRLRGRVKVPELAAAGVDDILGEYLIQKWIPGQNMLRAWLENPDVTTREWWVHQWIAALHAIHEERFPYPGELIAGRLKEYPNWRTYIESRLRKRLDLLMRVPAVDREFLLAAERYVRRQSPVLVDGPCCLIHRDLHFGNVLVDGPHLTAILDFELAESGPPDYELDTIFRFLSAPWLFAEPSAGSGVTPARFASVWIRLKRGYPEMFAVSRLRERLSLYALDHALSSLIRAYGGGWGAEAARDATLQRIGEILQGRYGPE